MRIQDSSSSDTVLNAIIVFFATSVVVVVVVVIVVVVVNDSSLLIDSANRRQRDEGALPEIAIQQAGIERLRAILLDHLNDFRRRCSDDSGDITPSVLHDPDGDLARLR